MLNKIKNKSELNPFFTDVLLENEVGVLVDKEMPRNSYIAIDIDEYYHKSVSPTPAIVDIFLVAQKLSKKERFHIYIAEMKNISRPGRFSVKNIYEKFTTAIEDFMKIKYKDIFMDKNFEIDCFRLFFISDAYRLKRKGFTDKQINSYLSGTKIAVLQSNPPFVYRNFRAMIEYRPPNPTLEWR
jgi:hypothetical protein